MTDFTYIVSASHNYTPELCALLGSLDYIGNVQDVHIIGMELEENFINQFKKLNYKAILHNISQQEWEEAHGRSEIACRKRYWYASKIGKDYKSVCVLDADMIFVRDPIQFFNIAWKTGYILGVCKEQNKVYDDEHHKFKGEFIIPQGYWNDKDLCNCPLFIDTNIWGDALEISWTWFIDGFPNTNMKCPDMDCLNIALIHFGGHDKIVKLVGNQWLGTNEQHLKPYIRVILGRDDKIWTENGVELFSYHGQYYKENWRKVQLENRHRCAEGYLGYSEKSDNMAQGALALLTDYFNRMLDYKIIIPHIDYIPK